MILDLIFLNSAEKDPIQEETKDWEFMIMKAEEFPVNSSFKKRGGGRFSKEFNLSARTPLDSRRGAKTNKCPGTSQ